MTPSMVALAGTSPTAVTIDAVIVACAYDKHTNASLSIESARNPSHVDAK
jgi:hypothetical protein